MTANPIALNFSAHARLKDIVGRGLIISDDIAIIELIKNSKDAGASGVEIFFRESAVSGETELMISDNGQGMTFEDIEKKWLNIAYSEKKTQVPEAGAYAGSKGIGRFSCDRLGKELEIITKQSKNSAIKLEVDWTKFEVDQRDREIGSINVFATQLSEDQYHKELDSNPQGNGTSLIIRKLRSGWGTDRLRQLRKELERFIIDPTKVFSINFHHWKYEENHPINGPIENKIFEELDFRASSIEAKIDDTGKHIFFELRHDGDYLFRSKERNPYKDLSNISLKLFFLNQPAKAFFKRSTGYRSVDYGSIFMFLNSFRVFPYGSAGNDWLGVDKRKAQGQRRFFGLRELVGFIEAIDSEEKFIPISSREGLRQNAAFQQLTADTQVIECDFDSEVVYGLFHKTMRKLEKFVVDGLDWDRIDREIGDDSEDELLAGNYKFLEGEKPVLETIDSVVRIRSPKDHIIEIDVNLQYLSKLANQEVQEYEDLVENLQEKFDGTPIDRLKPAEKRDLSRFISRQAKELSKKNETNVKLQQKASKTTQELRVERKKRIFAEFESTADQTRIIQLHHQIGLVAGSLQKRIDRVIRKYRQDPEKFTKQQIFETLEKSIFEIEKIRNVAKLASKADFDLSTNRVKEDIVQFIEEYLDNFKDVGIGWNLTTTFSNTQDIKLYKTFRPIEVTILIDNLIDNAGKANSRKVQVKVTEDNKHIYIEFLDDGDGLPDDIDPNELFEKGITSTSGSGIGLSHAKQITKELDGKIEILNVDGGSSVRIEFSK